MQIPVKQLMRADFNDWLQRRQSRLQIKSSTVTRLGQILDWVPPESQSSIPVATPPPAQLGSAVLNDPNRPTASVTFDVGEAGPFGHVPILRPDLSRVPDTTRLREFLSKPGGLRLSANKRKPTAPDPAGYFHASTAEWTTAYGCDAWFNVWAPQVNLPSSPGDDHSISQTWVQNHQTAQTQSLEAGLTVDVSLNGDSFNHLFTYYTTNGYASDGANVGGYNRLDDGWVQVHPSIYPGIRIIGTSQQGATPQLEIGLKYQLYAGNWWLGVNNNEAGPWIWLGYYPASLFNGGLAGEADWLSFGGEVYSGLADACQTTDQMGSGRLANAGWSYASFQRNIRSQSDTDGGMSAFNGAAEVDAAAASCPANQYSINTFMNSGGIWGSYQYFGGQS
jgi:hypothetical protein